MLSLAGFGAPPQPEVHVHVFSQEQRPPFMQPGRQQPKMPPAPAGHAVVSRCEQVKLVGQRQHTPTCSLTLSPLVQMSQHCTGNPDHRPLLAQVRESAPKEFFCQLLRHDTAQTLLEAPSLQ